MFANHPAEVALNVPIRSLEAVQAEKGQSRFLVGSCEVAGVGSSSNHLHLLGYSADSNHLKHEARLEHPKGPVHKICTSPKDKTFALTLAEDVNNLAGGGKVATLWKIPVEFMDSMVGYDDPDDDEDGGPLQNAADGVLEERAELFTRDASGEPLAAQAMVDVQWRRNALDDEFDDGTGAGSSTSGEILTLDQKGILTQWDAAFGSIEPSQNTTTIKNIHQTSWNIPPKMAWDPHNVNATAVATGSSLEMVDWRSDTSVPLGTVSSIAHCHRYGVTDLDFNPNKPFVLTTAGKDGLVKFWDLRQAKQPLMVASGAHRHCVSQVSYNPFHDQLVLSAGTDALVNLWRMSTISSAPLLTLPTTGMSGDDMDDDGPQGPNNRVSRFEHMESVYGAAWSAADAWVYASAGYDGKVVLHHVPSKEKYKILL